MLNDVAQYPRSRGTKVEAAPLHSHHFSPLYIAHKIKFKQLVNTHSSYSVYLTVILLIDRGLIILGALLEFL